MLELLRLVDVGGAIDVAGVLELVKLVEFVEGGKPYVDIRAYLFGSRKRRSLRSVTLTGTSGKRIWLGLTAATMIAWSCFGRLTFCVQNLNGGSGDLVLSVGITGRWEEAVSGVGIYLGS